MADVDGCFFCEATNPTTWMLTHLQPPATVMSCEEHAVLNVVSLLATLLGLDGDWIWKTIDAGVVAAAAEREAAEQAEAAREAKPDRPKRARAKPRAVAPADPESDEADEDEDWHTELAEANDGAV